MSDNRWVIGVTVALALCGALLMLAVGRGSGGKVIRVPSPEGPVIFQNSSVTSASAPMNWAFKP